MDAPRGRTTKAREKTEDQKRLSRIKREARQTEHQLLQWIQATRKQKRAYILNMNAHRTHINTKEGLTSSTYRAHYAYIAHASMINNADSFVNLANKRVPKALKALDLVGNLSNKSNYTYTKEQVAAIKKALKAKVNEVCRKFEDEGSNANTFKI